MSLINQMLKDLEARRNPQLPAGDVIPAAGSAAPARGKRPLTLILALLVVVLALGLGYTLLQQKRPAAATETVSPASTATVAEPAATPAQVTPAPKPQMAAAATATTPTRQPEAAPPVPPSPAAATSSSARLAHVTPSVIDGSWQPSSLILRGEGLDNRHRVVVSWAGKEKVLAQEQVEWLDSTTARIRLVTGNSDEIWQIALLRPDGSRSNSVEFEVIASPYVGSRSSGESTERPQMEKTIRPPSSEERADQLYQQGYRALQQRKADSAEKLWQQALTLEATHDKSREGLIALYLSQGRKVEASKLLEEGIQLHPENTQFALLYARLQAEQGDNAAALATLERAMGSGGERPELFALAAALYQQQRDYGKSISSYQRALQLQPQQSTWWMGLGISLEGDGKTAEAKSAYEEALRRGGLGAESQLYVRQRLQALE
jgi:MSHA biogenesis protein MshN